MQTWKFLSSTWYLIAFCTQEVSLTKQIMEDESFVIAQENRSIALSILSPKGNFDHNDESLFPKK